MERSLAGQAEHTTARALPDWVVSTLLTLSVAAMSTIIGMLAPLLVPLGAEYGLPVGRVAQLVAITALPWAISAPLAGPLSDRFGRKPLLLGGLAAAALTTVASAFAPSFEALLILRFLAGVGGGATGPIIMAYVGDYFAPERRSRAYGTVLTGFPVGAILGVPAVALIAGLVGWRWTFGVIGVMLGLMVVAVALVLPGLRRPGGQSLNVIAPLVPLLRRPAVLLLLLANAGERGGTTVAATFLPAYLTHSYGLGVAATAGPLVLVAAGALAGSWLGGRLADRFGKAGVYGVTELIGSVCALLVYFVAPSLAFTVVAAMLASLLGAAGRPAMLWLVSQISQEQRGAMLGLYSTSNQLAFSASTTVAGLLLAAGDYPAISFLCLALGLLAGVPSVWLARDPAVAADSSPPGR